MDGYSALYTIYIVEDEKDLRDLLKAYMEKEGFAVETFATGEDALVHADADAHLWLLDIMLPGEISGFDVLKRIRQTNDTPAVFITARDQEIDRIMGLEMGSDDYITKPFSPREVVLRVKSILKRTCGESAEQSVAYGDYRVEFKKRLASDDGGVIDLTSKEMDLLMMLLRHKNQAFKREQVLNHVWGDDYFGSNRVVDDLVKRLRKKMPKLKIETIYGYGYRLK